MSLKGLKGLILTGCVIAPSFLGATTVRVQGRQLLVNGSAFTMQGVAYSPTPVGSRVPNYVFWTDASQPYNTDFPLIKTMGANVVRVYDATQATKVALDAASTNGLFVIMGIPVTAAEVQTSTGRATVIARSTAVVSAWATHSAVLLWELGNEVTNNQSLAVATSWYTLLNQAAGVMKTTEIGLTGTSHPVSTSNKDINNIGSTAASADDASLSNLDIWGATVYRGSSFACPASVFVQYSTSSAKPFYLSEFGSDAFNSSTSKEDQSKQSNILKAQWPVIKSNLSSQSSSQVAIGGCIFEWNDEWWKSLFNTSDAVQDSPSGGDFLNACYDQSAQFEEWFGITSIKSGTNARGLRQGYYALQALWNPNAVAEVQNLPLIATIGNFPNPFQAGSASTKVKIQLNQPAGVGVRIFDMGGRQVVDLNSPQDLGGDLLQFVWDGRTSGGMVVASGLYIARVEAQIPGRDEVGYRRIVVIK